MIHQLSSLIPHPPTSGMMAWNFQCATRESEVFFHLPRGLVVTSHLNQVCLTPKLRFFSNVASVRAHKQLKERATLIFSLHAPHPNCTINRQLPLCFTVDPNFLISLQPPGSCLPPAIGIRLLNPGSVPSTPAVTGPLASHRCCASSNCPLPSAVGCLSLDMAVGSPASP